MKNYTFKRRFEEKEGWVLDEENFNEEINKLKIKYKEILNKEDCCAFFLIKQYFYKSGTSPDFQFCYDWEDFEFLLEKDKFFCAGDIIQVWIISDKNIVFDLKIPDENNLIPEKGAY